MAFLDYYEVLSVPPTATLEQIERAYKRLVTINHPDLFPNDPQGQAWATERMKQINEAHEVLIDPGRRAVYDRDRREHHASRDRNSKEQQQRQHREQRVPCPVCEQRGRLRCPVCDGRGDDDCPGCQGEQIVTCPFCFGDGTLTEAQYRAYAAEEQRAREQAKAQAARQATEAAAQQQAHHAAETRRRTVLAGVGILSLLFVARACSADLGRPVALSVARVPEVVRPTPYKPYVPPAPERTRPSATPTRPKLRSQHDRTPTQITFRNATPNTISVFWIDYDGAEVFYRTLGPGEAYVQDTFATHPWRLRDARTERELRTVVAGPTPSTVELGRPRRPPVAAPPTRTPVIPTSTPRESGEQYGAPRVEATRPEPLPTLAVPSGPIVRSLAELPPVLQLQTIFPGSGTLYGQSYRVVILHTNRGGLLARTAYLINGQYDRFEVTVGMESSGNLLQQAGAKVFGDGELLHETPSLGLGQGPVRISVSVKGITKLELQSAGLPLVVWTVIWADPRLIKD